MYAVPVDKIDSFFEAVSAQMPLFLPVDAAPSADGPYVAGYTADFALWKPGVALSRRLKTVRSAKDFFFPKSEMLVSYTRVGKSISVAEPEASVMPFAVFGVRACDAASFAIIDDVYLKTEPVDAYYKARREAGVVITLACNKPEETCFCAAYGIDPALPGGDISCWQTDDAFCFKAVTQKGEDLLKAVAIVCAGSDVLPEAPAVEVLQQSIREKVDALPFAHLDLSLFPCGSSAGADMLKLFNAPEWASLSESCLGCGTCTYVCPTCMCFDVRDFDSGNGITQTRCWDSCMFSDFTQMAAANPRITQKERFRQRFLHKLLYYPVEHGNVASCVGCGRCVESCPVHLNIIKVVRALSAAAGDAE